jgi:hypothetical protein
MISLIVHAVFGVLTTTLMVRWNWRLFARGTGITPLEVVYVIVGFASVVLGWYFNIRYVQQFGKTASWMHFTQSLFTNWAANSAAQDYILANAVLFPLWTISDGRRRGLVHPWIFFVMSLFTSFAFAMAAYLFVVERRVRLDVGVPVPQEA